MAAAFAVCAVLALPASVGATFAGRDGRIAFQSRVAGNLDIYTAASDGTDVRRITTHPGSDFTPRWSPDGRQIAFVGRRDGVDDLYIVDAGGGGERRIFTAANRDRGPAWSADGERIFFHSGPDLHVVNADGTGERQLTDDPALDLGAATAPRGQKLAFPRLVGDYLQLFTIRGDGGGLAPLTDTAAHNDQVNWSPHGNDLVFVRDDTGVDNDIYVMHANGTHEQRLTVTPDLIEFTPVWSPEGDRLAFARCANFFTSPDCGIFTMSVAGGPAMDHARPGDRAGLAGEVAALTAVASRRQAGQRPQPARLRQHGTPIISVRSNFYGPEHGGRCCFIDDPGSASSPRSYATSCRSCACAASLCRHLPARGVESSPGTWCGSGARARRCCDDWLSLA